MPIRAITMSTTAPDGATEEWTINTMGAAQGMQTLFKLIELIGEPLGHLGASGLGSKPNGEDKNSMESVNLGEKGLAIALGALAKNLGKPEAYALVTTLLSGLRKNAKSVNFDMEFAERYGLVLQLCAWILKENYGSFFVGALEGQSIGP